jgi:transcription termination factor Rho
MVSSRGLGDVYKRQDVLQKMWVLRKLLYNMDDLEAMEFLLDKIKATKNNGEFFDSMRK